MAFAPIFVADDKGFFQREGLTYKIDMSPNFKREIELLKEGAPRFLITSFVAVRAAHQGAEPKLLCNIFNQVIHRIVAKKEIDNVRGLKGKTMMVNAFGGTSEIEAKFVLRQHGINPETDLNFVEAGPGLEVAQLEALKRGEVDAIASSPPYWYLAEKEGFHTLGYAGDSHAGWGACALITSASFINRNASIIEKAVRAVVSAEKYMVENKEGTLRVILDHIELVDQETASALYDQLKDAWRPQLNSEYIKNYVDTYCRENALQTIPVEKLIERSFLEKTIDSR